MLQGLLAEFAKRDNLLTINAISGRIIEMRQVGFLGFQGVEVELEMVEHAHDVLLQVEVIDGLGWGVPQLGLLVAREEQVEAGVLAVGFQRLFFVANFRSVKEIDISELKELHVADLAVLVEGDALQSTPHQGLAHDIEVAAQRIQYLDITLRIEGGESLAVSGLGERVVHNFVETVGDEHIADFLLHLVGVGFGSATNGSMDTARNLNVVVTVNAQDFLHHIGGTGYIDFAGVYIHHNVLVVLLNNLTFKAFQYIDGLCRVDDLASHFVQIVKFQIHAGRGEVAVFHVLDFGGNRSAGQLLY